MRYRLHNRVTGVCPCSRVVVLTAIRANKLNFDV